MFFSLLAPCPIKIQGQEKKNPPSSFFFKWKKTMYIFSNGMFIGLAYQGKNIVFRFIIEYSSSFKGFLALTR